MTVASITIRNLDGDAKNRLRVGAARNGRAMEEEPGLILGEFRIALATADRAVDQIDPPSQIGKPGGAGETV